MGRYIIKRLLMLIPVMIGVSFLVFVVTDLAPGDAVDMMASTEMSLEQKEALREEMGLNRNVIVRYGDYLWNMIHGDLGKSYRTGADVFESYITRLPATAYLAVATVLVAVVLSIPLGIYSAKHRGSIADSSASVVALLGLSLPGFFIGLVLIIIFSLHLKLFDSGGNRSFTSIIMPAVSGAMCMLATMQRTTRSSMLDALSMEHLDLARSKGVPEKDVINKHALKNALIPILTVVGTELGACLGGSVVIEKLFSWPGVGTFIVDAVNNRDIPIVCGFVTLTTMLVTLVQLFVDILYAYIDPRIKAKYAKQGMRKTRRIHRRREEVRR